MSAVDPAASSALLAESVARTPPAAALPRVQRHRRAWGGLLKAHAGAAAAFVFIALLALLAVFAPWAAGSDPAASSGPVLLAPGSASHWWGTDLLGRDLWARSMQGAGTALMVGATSASIATAAGLLVGLLAGWGGGRLDALLMRLAGFFQLLPRLVLAPVVLALYGTSFWKIVLFVAVLSWPHLARTVRAAAAPLRDAPFIDAARMAGMGRVALVLHEVLPHVARPVAVFILFQVAAAILAEVSLAFFGLGDPNLVSWGAMLREAQPHLAAAWWMAVFPGALLAFTMLSFKLLGRALRDAR